MKRSFFQVIKFTLSSFGAWLAEYLLYSLLVYLLVDNVSVRILYYIARVVITVPQFIVNRQLVFSKNQSVHRTAVLFFALQIVIMFAAAEATHLLTLVVDLGETLTPIVVRVPVDVGMFVVSYIIQKKFIFK